MLHTVAHFETTPPLYFVLIWGWAKLFGTGAIALRSLSTIAGIALVPIAYLSARSWSRDGRACSRPRSSRVNPFMIWYSQEARAYMLLAALTAARSCGSSAPARSLAAQHRVVGALLGAGGDDPLLRRVHRRAGGALAAVASSPATGGGGGRRDRGGAGGDAPVRGHRHHPRDRVDRQAASAFTESRSRRWSGACSLSAARHDASGAWRAGSCCCAAVGALVLVSRTAAPDRRSCSPAASPRSCSLAPIALGFLGQDYFLSRNVIPAFVPLVVVIAAACASTARAEPRGGAWRRCCWRCSRSPPSRSRPSLPAATGVAGRRPGAGPRAGAPRGDRRRRHHRRSAEDLPAGRQLGPAAGAADGDPGDRRRRGEKEDGRRSPRRSPAVTPRSCQPPCPARPVPCR